MQLTRAGEYGILGALYLAERYDQPVVMLAQIAEAEEVPESFLRKIFGTLAKHGIVEAFRGRCGGFRLARPPDQTSMREIVEAIEGPIFLNICLMRREACPRRDVCPVHDIWQEAQDALTGVLDKYSLADLAAQRAARQAEVGSHQVS
jgi:Rrf2 family protein